MLPTNHELSQETYIGTFTKQDGTTRTMLFKKILNPIKESKNGKETVWDVEKQCFRVFNHNTKTREIKEIKESK